MNTFIYVLQRVCSCFWTTCVWEMGLLAHRFTLTEKYNSFDKWEMIQKGKIRAWADGSSTEGMNLRYRRDLSWTHPPQSCSLYLRLLITILGIGWTDCKDYLHQLMLIFLKIYQWKVRRKFYRMKALVWKLLY